MRVLKDHVEDLEWLHGETYGDYCDRLETALVDIIEAKDTSRPAIRRLAFILMEAPADFDDVSHRVVPPFRLAHEFFSQQDMVTREFFRKAAKRLPRARTDRIESLLTSRKGI